MSPSYSKRLNVPHKVCLSPREEDILFLMYLGLEPAQIRAVLGNNRSVIYQHLQRARKFLNAKTSYQALAFFIEQYQGTWKWTQLQHRWSRYRVNSSRPVRLGLYPRTSLFAARPLALRKKLKVCRLWGPRAQNWIECSMRRDSSGPTVSSPTSASTDHQRTRSSTSS